MPLIKSDRLVNNWCCAWALTAAACLRADVLARRHFRSVGYISDAESSNILVGKDVSVGRSCSLVGCDARTSQCIESCRTVLPACRRGRFALRTSVGICLNNCISNGISEGVLPNLLITLDTVVAQTLGQLAIKASTENSGFYVPRETTRAKPNLLTYGRHPTSFLNST